MKIALTNVARDGGCHKLFSVRCVVVGFLGLTVLLAFMKSGKLWESFEVQEAVKMGKERIRPNIPGEFEEPCPCYGTNSRDNLFMVQLSNKAPLNFMQTCSAKRAAKIYTNSNVCLITNYPLAKSKYWPHVPNIFVCEYNLTEIVGDIKGFQVVLDEFGEEKLIENLKIRDGFQSVATLSDALRYPLLYKYGGIYLDMDVISLKKVPNTVLNFVGKEPPGDVGSAILKFQKGHVMLKHLIEHIPNKIKVCGLSYNRKFGCIGPGFLESFISKPKKHSLIVFESEFMYPLNYRSQLLYPFSKTKFVETKQITKKAYFTHLWSQLIATKYSTAKEIEVLRRSSKSSFIDAICSDD